MNNIDLSAELVCKIGINAEKYPMKKVSGRNLKYDEL